MTARPQVFFLGASPLPIDIHEIPDLKLRRGASILEWGKPPFVSAELASKKVGLPLCTRQVGPMDYRHNIIITSSLPSLY